MTTLLNVPTSFSSRRPSIPTSPIRSHTPHLPLQPTQSNGPQESLLSPTNPAFDSFAPQGGILLNKQRPGSDDGSAGDEVGRNFGSADERRGSVSVDTETRYSSSPTNDHLIPFPSSPSVQQRPTSNLVRAPSSTKIRFAPLPTPNRQRSLSTGRDIITMAQLEPGGQRVLTRSVAGRNWSQGGEGADENQAVSDNEGEDDSDDAESEGPSGRRGSASSWMGGLGRKKHKTGSFSSSLGSSGSTAKKMFMKPLDGLLSSSPSTGNSGAGDNGLSFGAPLRKTLSTGGLMGNSPFRSAHEQERKRSFLSPSSTSSGSLLSSSPSATTGFHKRTSSSVSTNEKPDFSSLSSSLGYKAETEFPPASEPSSTTRRPVKMLNGRVYGAKNKTRTALPTEPEFNEWGGLAGGNKGGIGSQPERAVKKAQNDDDDDDGSGMGWVKRRKEQRERERRASEAGPGVQMDSAERRDIVGSAPEVMVDPERWRTDRASDLNTMDERFNTLRGETIVEESSVPGTPREDGTHRLAIQVPRTEAPSGRWNGVRDSALDDESDEEEGSDSESGGSDFEKDESDEEEVERPKLRSTSSAAGVEVMLRHKE